jgi:hypothetical protein
MQQQGRAEEYQGQERAVTFVARADWMLWQYCQTRFDNRWNDGRRIPASFQHEGRVGWWFPTMWIQDFAEKHSARRYPAEAA